MFRQQPKKSIFAIPFASEPTLKAELKSALGAKMKSAPTAKSKYISQTEAEGKEKSKPELKSTTPELILNLDKVDELGKMEAPNSRPLSKNTWCKWYDWLNSHIPKTLEKSVSNVKKISQIFFPKTANQKRLQTPLMISFFNENNIVSFKDK